MVQGEEASSARQPTSERSVHQEAEDHDGQAEEKVDELKVRLEILRQKFKYLNKGMSAKDLEVVLEVAEFYKEHDSH